MSEIAAEVLGRASKIRLILLDVDGVLTDGRLHLGSAGDDGRAFFVRDGLGIRVAQDCGLVFGIVSGRRSAAVASRAAELRIEEIHQGVLDKGRCIVEIQTRLGLAAEEICFMGDDLIDLPALQHAGLAAAPADADSSARRIAHYVTRRPGGRGAVRELTELVLHARGEWNEVLRRFSGD